MVAPVNPATTSAACQPQQDNSWLPSGAIAGIENSLHWTLDVTFREDQCRVRKDHGPHNLATLRQISHNLLKNENTLKVGIQGKRLNAGWDEHYLLKVLLG